MCRPNFSVISKRERNDIKKCEEAMLKSHITTKQDTGATLDLLEVGEHCTFDLCKQFTFLPTNCDCCAKPFCLNHFRPLDHKCTKYLPEEHKVPTCPKCDKTLRKPKDMSYLNLLKEHQSSGCKKFLRVKKIRCKQKRCKKSAKFCCNNCSKNYCAAHRWPDIHPCTLQNSCRGKSIVLRPVRHAHTSAGVSCAH